MAAELDKLVCDVVDKHLDEMRIRANRLRERERQKKIKIQRPIQRKHFYGLTEEEFEEKRKSQRDCCAVCGRKLFENLKERTDFYVDHDHETGKIRGLVCPRCNTTVGLIENDKPNNIERDDPRHYRQIIAYLDEWS